MIFIRIPGYLLRVLLIALTTTVLGCQQDKTPFADVYAVFEYDGAKIDTTTTEKDQLIFRNVDGTPPVYVPTYSGNLCDDKIFIGTYPLNDTLEWHLRLVDPDGDPANFKAYFNENRDLILLNETLHFVLPTAHDFSVRTEQCKKDAFIVIGN
ncbi:MAG: hypothetical protein HYZ14_13200 [Bacteroidetes bacterium]|nr:hypothetical protein [Bacteroidota bacterium]